MVAITVRGLTEEIRAGLRRRAAQRGMSVEALVRDVLTAVAAGGESVTEKPVTGMSENPMTWPAPAPRPVPGTSAGFETIWGALAGRIHVSPGYDLAAGTAVEWDAEGGQA